MIAMQVGVAAVREHVRMLMLVTKHVEPYRKQQLYSLREKIMQLGAERMNLIGEIHGWETRAGLECSCSKSQNATRSVKMYNRSYHLCLKNVPTIFKGE